MSTFDFRRRLAADERRKLVGAAVGAGAGVGAALGLAVWYFGRIWLQRSPLSPTPPAAAVAAQPEAAAPVR